MIMIFGLSLFIILECFRTVLFNVHAELIKSLTRGFIIIAHGGFHETCSIVLVGNGIDFTLCT